uniref:Uncharacterized protein n=1 Tax=Lutzomyia longipalpis TaxID=7200 RepID=A0A3F2ZDB9_LUTLO
MFFTDSLGILFIFQKYTTIPNFHYKSPLKLCTIILRTLPLILFILWFLVEFFISNFYKTIHPNNPNENIVGVTDFAMKLSYFVNRYTVTGMIVTGLRNNIHHIKLIYKILALEDKLRCLAFKRNIKLISRCNIEAASVIVFNCSLMLGYCLFDMIDSNFFIVQFYSMIVYIFGSMMFLYFINFFREFIKILNFIIDLTKMYGNRFRIQAIVQKFCRTIPLVNSALGNMIFVDLVQHVLLAVLTIYYLLWLTFEGTYVRAHEAVTIACYIWLITIFGLIIELCRVGNKLKRKIQQLMDFQKYILCPIEDALQSKSIKFNKEQLQLWRFHIETRILAAESIEINNKGYFTVLSFIITYFIILIQFKQMEE